MPTPLPSPFSVSTVTTDGSTCLTRLGRSSVASVRAGWCVALSVPLVVGFLEVGGHG